MKTRRSQPYLLSIPQITPSLSCCFCSTKTTATTAPLLPHLPWTPLLLYPLPSFSTKTESSCSHDSFCRSNIHSKLRITWMKAATDSTCSKEGPKSKITAPAINILQEHASCNGTTPWLRNPCMDAILMHIFIHSSQPLQPNRSYTTASTPISANRHRRLVQIICVGSD
ncbi:hypothetical protein SORBI_3005G114201 [Sorghum bicolor]|uniref:Uncharacterized protein n=1 Tax=Sorghum bicolor TaxID=4558 RepID=A0A1Z5RJA8_SORBI|nr:hypothetical protein SORBI_3005G114201 [Sorghum bicolor]